MTTKKTEYKKEIPVITRLEVLQRKQGLEHPALNSITNRSLFYAIDRTLDKLTSVTKTFEPKRSINDYDEYLKEVRDLHEKLSGGKTTENPMNGEKIWDVNYGSNEYVNKINALKEKYGVKTYDEWMAAPFDENIDDYIHFVNEKEVDIDKDVPNYGVYKLIKFLFKNKD